MLEDPAIKKAVHNQPVDDHAMHNHGVALAGCVNTLGLSRWAWPELVTMGGFGLKNLMFVKLRREPIAEYEDVVSDTRMITVSRERKRKVTDCSCGVEKCRKRKGHEKTKRTFVESYQVEKQEVFQHPLESIDKSHQRWDLLVRYAAEDAVAALEVLELAESQPDPAIYPFGKIARPGFSQAVEDEIVRMERAGFRIDTEYCASQAAKAEADEVKELHWLRRWFRTNLGQDDGEWFTYEDADVNGIWSSPKQLGELFDYLDWPRSPVWKKGRVKPGEIKLDSTALEWISRNCPEAKQLIKHVLHLKRIRSGKKYLVKMRDCGGWVNPICGPAGDRDDRNGAVTGRLGIKGVLEAQQLPSREEADLYQIRKAVIA